jgi:hypothetical protein
MKGPVFAKGWGHERRGIRCDETEPRRVHRSKCGSVYWAIEPTDSCWEQPFAPVTIKGLMRAYRRGYGQKMRFGETRRLLCCRRGKSAISSRKLAVLRQARGNLVAD